MDDEKYYQTVADELRTNTIKEALWTKAIAKSQGDENRTKATYIQLRVDQLMREDQETTKANRDNADRTAGSGRAGTEQLAQWIAAGVLIIIIIYVVHKWVWPKLEHYF